MGSKIPGNSACNVTLWYTLLPPTTALSSDSGSHNLLLNQSGCLLSFLTKPPCLSVPQGFHSVSDRYLLSPIRHSHVQSCLWFLGALNGQRSHSVFAIREGPISFHREVPRMRVEARARAPLLATLSLPLTSFSSARLWRSSHALPASVPETPATASPQGRQDCPLLGPEL